MDRVETLGDEGVRTDIAEGAPVEFRAWEFPRFDFWLDQVNGGQWESNPTSAEARTTGESAESEPDGPAPDHVAAT